MIKILYFCFLVTLIPFNLYLLVIIYKHCYATFMEPYFDAMGSIKILDVSLLVTYPRSSISSFK